METFKWCDCFCQLHAQLPPTSWCSAGLTRVSFLSSPLLRCHITVSLSQSVAVSDPKQVQLIHSKNASSPTSPTGPTSPSWTDEGSAPVSPNPEVGKDLFNMKPWVILHFYLPSTDLCALLTTSVPPQHAAAANGKTCEWKSSCNGTRATSAGHVCLLMDFFFFLPVCLLP